MPNNRPGWGALLPRYNIPETFGAAISYEAQLHWFLENWDEVAEYANDLEQPTIDVGATTFPDTSNALTPSITNVGTDINAVLDFTYPVIRTRFADPLQWDFDTAYDVLTVVSDGNGNSYTSRQAVPARTPLTDTDYWVPTGVYDASLQAIRDDVTSIKNGYARVYRTVADMQADTELVSGMICHTLGFHTVGDGGAAWYVIGSGEPNGMDVLQLATNDSAILAISGACVSPEMMGAYGDGTVDCTEVINHINDIGTNIYGSGRYLVSSPVISGSNKSIYLRSVEINGSDDLLTFKNCSKMSINIGEIDGNRFGVAFVSDGSGVQLNDVHIGSVYATERCVSFNFTSGVGEWINENTFDIRLLNTGSTRLGTGIYIGDQISTGSSNFNRNVFINTDFEQVKYGVLVDRGAKVASCVFDRCRVYEIPAECYMIRCTGGIMSECVFRPKTSIKWQQALDPESIFSTDVYYMARNIIDCLIETLSGRSCAKGAFFTGLSGQTPTLSYITDSATRRFVSDEIDLTGIHAPLEYSAAYASANFAVKLSPSDYIINGLSRLPIFFSRQSVSLTTITVSIGDTSYTVDVSGVTVGSVFSLVVLNGSIIPVIPGVCTL